MRIVDNIDDIFSGEGALGYCVIYSLDECEPCDLLKSSIIEVFQASDDVASRFELVILALSRAEKKKIGRLVLSGIDRFPTVRIFEQGRMTQEVIGVPDSWGRAEIISSMLLRMT